jgi:AcrR family transcriptional regulator
VVRVRTEDKRREIIRIAADAFEEQGYERTSMSEISKRVGGSKATLYGYFGSKEELLLAILDVDVSAGAERLMNLLLGAPNPHDGLVELGVAYMERRLHPRTIAMHRIVSNQPEENGLAAVFYRNVLRPAWERMSERLALMMEEGRLRKGDPWMAAMQWKALVELDMFERRVLGAVAAIDPAEVRRAAIGAADMFMAVYAPDADMPARPRLGKTG